MKQKYKLCISGTADTSICNQEALDRIEELGREVVLQGGVLVNGATTGAPYVAALGAKKADGFVIGISPASSELEHVKKYHLPTDQQDIIIYTGFGYSGRNLLLTRSADAVIIVSGRMGTLNEFTIAFEDNKPIGVLTGTGGTADKVEEIVRDAHRGVGKIAYDDDPKRLVARLIEMINLEKNGVDDFYPRTDNSSKSAILANE